MSRSLPALASPAAEPGAPLAIEAFLEDKYDGMRAQVHWDPPAPR